jgi:hypothetical protein
MKNYAARATKELDNKISRIPHPATSHLTLAYSRQTAIDLHACFRICADQTERLRAILRTALLAHKELSAHKAPDAESNDYEKAILLAVSGLSLAQSLLNGCHPDKEDDGSLAGAVRVLTSTSVLLNVLAGQGDDESSNDVTI